MKKWLLALILIFGVGLVGGAWVGISGGEDESKALKKVELARQPELTATPAVKVITVAAVGDVMLGRSVREQMLKRNDWTWPFLETATSLAEAEVTLGNLEAPIVENCEQNENRMVFCMNPEAIAGLTLAGFDIFTLANNHMLNYGLAGLESTRRYLETNNMNGSYNGELVIKEIEGVKIGVLGYDDVTGQLDLEKVGGETASAAAKTEVVIAMVHWGNEYMASPSARQRQIAQVLADNGTDIIIGSHPHWVQNVEKVGKTLVFWSLGNFVFDQMWSEETRQGAMAKIGLQLTNNQLGEIQQELVRVKIYDYGQPRFELN